MPKLQQRPYAITVFVPDGDPDGLRVVERSGCPGIGIVFNRTNFKQAYARSEINKTGIYVLVGSSEDGALPTIYVGEGDPVKGRLSQHYSKKEFWDWAVFFVAKDNSLNKAHVQQLESRLLGLARAAKQCKLDNIQQSLPPTLSEMDIARAEDFLDEMLSIFPLLGLGVFEKAERKQKPLELFYVESKGIKASGYEDAKGFVVCKGSEIVEKEAQSIQHLLSTLRKDLVTQGIVQSRIFTQDQVFNSPSTAAGVVLGRVANGRIEWKNAAGKTLKQLQIAAAGQS